MRPPLSNPALPSDTLPLANGAAAIGTSRRYARMDHVHPTQLSDTQRLRVQTAANGLYTWVFPVAYGGGVVPIVEMSVEGSSGSTDTYTVQLNGTPTNTQAVIRVVRTAQTVVALIGLTILSIPASPGATWVHLTARAP